MDTRSRESSQSPLRQPNGFAASRDVSPVRGQATNYFGGTLTRNQDQLEQSPTLMMRTKENLNKMRVV